MHIVGGNAFGPVVGHLDSPSTGSRGQISLLDAGTTFVPLTGETKDIIWETSAVMREYRGHFFKEDELDYNSEVTLSNPKCLGPSSSRRE